MDSCWQDFVPYSCVLAWMHNWNRTWRPKPGTIATRWAKQVSPSKVLPEYPRPQLIRKQWINLNGLWDYAITDKTATAADNFSGKILVPYPIESSLSGVKKKIKP